ncbi:uncharacterized protein LOC143280863 isoform X2 [Babylonia areolata]|uniref:uncharacterized protein LOC143280863 isoform X2 n=1 Tax=Babylonia areolata TaxID=304850 RepID=UPI003FD06B42
MTIKIFIGNLSEDTEADDLRILFEKYGTVAECDVLKNYGFVHMANKSEADKAISSLNGYNIKGQRMRVELSTGKRGNPRGDRRGSDYGGGRSRPYLPGPPRRAGLPPPPPDYDRYDPYYRYPYPERDPYYRVHPADRYLPPPPRLPPADRYALARERLLPEERAAYALPDPRDRLLVRERLPPPYPEDAAYERLRAVERAPLPADPYYRERSPPPARPPPEYYDRKPPLMRNPPPSAVEPASSRLTTTAYPPSNGYDYYRRPAPAAERSSYGGAGSGQDYYAPPPRGSAGYDRPLSQHQHSQVGGGYGGQQQPHQQQSKPYDSQAALQTKPIFF